MNDVVSIVKKAAGEPAAFPFDIHPLGEHYIVQMAEQPDVTEGGLFLPNMEQDSRDPEVAFVVAVPVGERDGIEPGSFVLMQAYMGTRFEVNDVEFVAVHRESILARIAWE